MVKVWRYGAAVLAASAAIVSAAAQSPPGQAQPPPESRSYYLNALAELRQARELVQRPPGEQLSDFETQALEQIDFSMGVLARVAADGAQPPPGGGSRDLPAKPLDRYYAAVKILGQCQRNVMSDRDPRTRGLREGAAAGIAKARQILAQAIVRIAGTG